ncbi:MAG: hypothetical protein OEY96_13460 [Gammaproteobacteria bacterium]|nr:hypothetical protein [Gammaproteobacteria bacterium]
MPNNKKSFSLQNLNLIIALCAILISVASFYATYLQANAAHKQVKAMTLPLLQFEHHNVEKDEHKLVFKLKNAGMGPAVVKKVTFIYNNIESTSLSKYIKTCCENEVQEYQQYHKRLAEMIAQGKPLAEAKGFGTNPISNFILPGQSDYDMLIFPIDTEYANFWNALDNARFYTKVRVCYCSLLDECYISENAGDYKPVESCSE